MRDKLEMRCNELFEDVCAAKRMKRELGLAVPTEFLVRMREINKTYEDAVKEFNCFLKDSDLV